MDRRRKKTREAIFGAFSRLLQKKRYEHITVQEIIDEADVGRSTFYAHFETKDELLHALCRDIFVHVFTMELPQEIQDRKEKKQNGLEYKLGHILYHLLEHKEDLLGILSGDSEEIFMRCFRGYLQELFARYLQEFSVDVPEDYLLNHLVASFAETVKWWILGKDQYTPQEIAAFYRKVTQMGKIMVQ